MASGVRTATKTVLNAHVTYLVDSYRRCLAEYARTRRVTELFPLPVWQQVRLTDVM